MKTVVGLGEVLWDVYPDRRTIGGAPANTALHAVKLGVRGVIVSAAGPDEAGSALIRRIEEMGGEIRYIQKHGAHATGSVRVSLDAHGNPHFECSRDTAFDHLVWQEDLVRLAAECDAVVTGTLAQRNRDSRAVIQRFMDITSALKVFDVNFRGWHDEIEAIVRSTLEKIDIVKMNETELDQMRLAFGQSTLSDETFLSRLIREYRLRAAALTLGPDGCVLADGHDCVRIPGRPIRAVDTTGCGDAFTAGLILKRLEGASLQATGAFANGLGALIATQRGAVPNDTMDDLDKILKDEL